jgi:subtilisin family serine protease
MAKRNGKGDHDKEIEETSCKLHPRLRVIRNGGRTVNAMRSDSGNTVACAAPVQGELASAPAYAESIRQRAEPLATKRAGARAPLEDDRKKLHQVDQADNAYVNVIIEMFHDSTRASSEHVAAVKKIREMIEAKVALQPGIRGSIRTRGNMISATVPVTLLDDFGDERSIAFVHPADPLKLDVPTPRNSLKREPHPHDIKGAAKHKHGAGVLVGIIDVGGFDFAHQDFINTEGTRFVAIWDQGGDFRDHPAGFGYGSEITRDHMNAAIELAEKGKIPATMLEPQSQMTVGSHGTHVASIAAGNTGVCCAAEIAAVLIDVPLPDDPIERRRLTFSDTSRITDAVEYLLEIAGTRPIVINISLGTNGGAHDGSSGVSRWLDAYLGAPKRAICVAAGNAGQDSAEHESDFGWMMGRIHAAGRVPARGLEVELEWTVIGDGIEDVSENELEIWYPAQDRFKVKVKPPNGENWIEVEPLSFVENKRLANGTTISIYNELYHPTNGSNYIGIYLSPNLDPVRFRGIESGNWRVRIYGQEVRDGRFNAWIERDDPVEIASPAGRRLFRFPSFFTLKSNVDSHSISSLACGHRVIAVANLDDVRSRINASSSQGPTRDGRCKPEIAAPGTDIIAANGFGVEPWTMMSGTSMASPYVAGVVGLMLAAKHDLTAAQCAGILQRTARPLPGASYDWINDVGYGRIHPDGAVAEAMTINTRTDLEKKKKRLAR